MLTKFCFVSLILLLSSLVWADLTVHEKINYSPYYTYHNGDNPDWATQDYDDSLWKKTAVDSFPAEEWNGIGWFRVWVTVDSSILRKPLGFSCQLVGAIDIFIDGRYRFSFGKVGSSRSDEEPLFVNSYLAPEVFVFLKEEASQIDKSKHLISIRYSSYLLESPISIGINPSFKIRIDDFQQLRLDQRELRSKAKSSQMLFIGIFLTFSLIHLLLFIFYPPLRANFYFAILTAVASILVYLRYETLFISNPRMYVVNFVLSDICVILFLLAMLQISYYVLNVKKSRLIISFIILGFILSIIFAFRPFMIWPVMIVFDIVLLLELLRTLITFFLSPKKLHLKGSWIILIGIVPIGIVGLYQFLAILNIVKQFWDFIDIPLTYYAFIGFSVSMSVFLSRTFAWTNKNLEEQLEQVKILSEKTLKQEVEQVRLTSENQRKSEELKKARELQLSMLPKTVPEIPTAEIAVYMKTATEVGGDYYDFALENNGTLTIAFGDATGHGMQAGSVVTATKSLFKSLSTLKNPAHILQQISDPLRRMGFNRLVMAMIVAKINKYNINVSVAGMPYPIVYRSAKKEIEEISLSGFPLGSFKNFQYQSKKMIFKRNDTILFMSDGFQEMFNEQGEIFGDERAIESFEKCAQKSPREIINQLISTAENWAGSHELEDDMTLLVIKFK